MHLNRGWSKSEPQCWQVIDSVDRLLIQHISNYLNDFTPIHNNKYLFLISGMHKTPLYIIVRFEISKSDIFQNRENFCGFRRCFKKSPKWTPWKQIDTISTLRILLIAYCVSINQSFLYYITQDMNFWACTTLTVISAGEKKIMDKVLKANFLQRRKE